MERYTNNRRNMRPDHIHLLLEIPLKYNKYKKYTRAQEKNDQIMDKAYAKKYLAPFRDSK